MSYTLEVLEEGQIVIVTLGADFDVLTELKTSMQERLALMETAPDHVVFITDSRNYYPIRRDDVIDAAKQIYAEEGKALSRHPKMLKSVTITGSKLKHRAIKGMTTTMLGRTDTCVFGTREAGIEHARKLLAVAKKIGK